MEPHRRTEFTASGLKLRTADGSVTHDLLAGSMHYWRTSPASWRTCLRAIRRLGFRFLHTTVPWSVHASTAATSWSGDLDLPRFLDCAAQEDLRVVLGVGPGGGAELTHFGLPERLLRRSDVQAVSARNTPVWLPAPPRMFPLPSYAARAFREEVARWFGELGAVVEDLAGPAGPLAAVQLDYPLTLHYRRGVYDCDYHPDALRWWAEFSSDLPPPRNWSPDNAHTCVLWSRFKQDYAARAVQWLSAELYNTPLGQLANYCSTPATQPESADPLAYDDSVDVVAFDSTWSPHTPEAAHNRALHACSSAAVLPLATRVSLGEPAWRPPSRVATSQSRAISTLSAGARGLCFEMAVDRERWHGAAISDNGDVQPAGHWLQQLLSALRDLDWTHLRRRASVGLIVSRADAHFGIASSFANPIPSALTDIAGITSELFRDERATTTARLHTTLQDALQRAQLAYSLVDERCSVRQLQGYDLLLLACTGRVDRAAWGRLCDLSQQGVKVVVGPAKPTLDEFDGSLGQDAIVPRGIGRIRLEAFDDVEGLATDLAALVPATARSWTATNADVNCTAFERPEGVVRAVVVENPTAAALATDLRTPPEVLLADALSGQPLTGVTLELAAGEARLVRVG